MISSLHPKSVVVYIWIFVFRHQYRKSHDKLSENIGSHVISCLRKWDIHLLSPLCVGGFSVIKVKIFRSITLRLLPDVAPLKSVPGSLLSVGTTSVRQRQPNDRIVLATYENNNEIFPCLASTLVPAGGIRLIPIAFRLSGEPIAFLALFSSSEKRRLCYRRVRPSVRLSVCKPIFSRTIRHTEPIFSASLRLYFPRNQSKFGSFLTTKFGITW